MHGYIFTQKNDSQRHLIYLQEAHMEYQTTRTMALFAHTTHYPFPPELKQKLRNLKAYQCDDLDGPLVDIDANAPPSSLHWWAVCLIHGRWSKASRLSRPWVSAGTAGIPFVPLALLLDREGEWRSMIGKNTLLYHSVFAKLLIIVKLISLSLSHSLTLTHTPSPSPYLNDFNGLV